MYLIFSNLWVGLFGDHEKHDSVGGRGNTKGDLAGLVHHGLQETPICAMLWKQASPLR